MDKIYGDSGFVCPYDYDVTQSIEACLEASFCKRCGDKCMWNKTNSIVALRLVLIEANSYKKFNYTLKELIELKCYNAYHVINYLKKNKYINDEKELLKPLLIEKTIEELKLLKQNKNKKFYKVKPNKRNNMERVNENSPSVAVLKNILNETNKQKKFNHTKSNLITEGCYNATFIPKYLLSENYIDEKGKLLKPIDLSNIYKIIEGIKKVRNSLNNTSKKPALPQTNNEVEDSEEHSYSLNVLRNVLVGTNERGTFTYTVDFLKKMNCFLPEGILPYLVSKEYINLGGTLLKTIPVNKIEEIALEIKSGCQNSFVKKLEDKSKFFCEEVKKESINPLVNKNFVSNQPKEKETNNDFPINNGKTPQINNSTLSKAIQTLYVVLYDFNTTGRLNYTTDDLQGAGCYYSLYIIPFLLKNGYMDKNYNKLKPILITNMEQTARAVSNFQKDQILKKQTKEEEKEKANKQKGDFFCDIETNEIFAELKKRGYGDPYNIKGFKDSEILEESKERNIEKTLLEFSNTNIINELKRRNLYPKEDSIKNFTVPELAKEIISRGFYFYSTKEEIIKNLSSTEISNELKRREFGPKEKTLDSFFNDEIFDELKRRGINTTFASDIKSFSDTEIVKELRERKYEVSARKVVEI